MLNLAFNYKKKKKKNSNSMVKIVEKFVSEPVHSKPAVICHKHYISY